MSLQSTSGLRIRKPRGQDAYSNASRIGSAGRRFLQIENSTTMDALISVAMAAYNGERFIRKQMDSILIQTYRNIEVIACDDCSTDSTWEILQAYAARDGRVKCFQNEKNLGFKKNFEKAISLCNGEFIALSDQDDIWLEEKLEISLKAFDRRRSAGKQCDIVCSTALWIDEDEAPLSGRFEKIASLVNHIPNDKKKQFAILILNGFVQGATLLAKASFLKQCLPVSDLCKYHDYWFAQKATLQKGILYIPKPLVLYRRHSSQVTWENRSIYSRGSKEKLQKRISETRENLNNIQASLNLPEEYLRIVQEAAKFNERQRHRDLFKLAYSFKNCGARYSIWICLEAVFAHIKRKLNGFRGAS